MLFLLVFLALSALAGAVSIHAAGFGSAVPVHLALAGGAMPLIAGALLHFVPVLTRSAAPGRGLRPIPLLMLTAGALAFASFLFPAHATALRNAAATFGMLGAATLTGWIVYRSRKSLGGPHPGLHWYLAAVICLLIALASILLMHALPAQYVALRRFHLHLNTLGFIGLTAVGTLQVLLPTAVGRADPGSGARLRGDLKWALAGTLLISAGSAWQPLLAWPGLLMWSVSLVRLAGAWWALYRTEMMQWSGPAIALAGALFGFVMALALGAGHGIGRLPTSHASLAYLFAFMLPLVTGAAGYLLPLWLRPGIQTEWHTQVRRALSRFSAVRVVLFVAAGVITGSWAAGDGWWLAAAGLVLFALQLRVLARR